VLTVLCHATVMDTGTPYVVSNQAW